MTFDRDTFFNIVRDELFDGALTQENVDGFNLLLALWENEQTGSPMSDLRWLSYVLATVYWETGQRIWPCVEGGSQEYLTSKDYYPFVGRGFVQLTWEANYRSAGASLGLIGERDLVAHPEMALDSLISARVLYRGCSEGWFTGAKLGQFFNDSEDNAYDARTIVNGHDKATEIAGIHEKFLAALQEAKKPATGPAPEDEMRIVYVDVTSPLDVAVVVKVNDENA